MAPFGSSYPSLAGVLDSDSLDGDLELASFDLLARSRVHYLPLLVVLDRQISHRLARSRSERLSFSTHPGLLHLEDLLWLLPHLPNVRSSLEVHLLLRRRSRVRLRPKLQRPLHRMASPLHPNLL